MEHGEKITLQYRRLATGEAATWSAAVEQLAGEPNERGRPIAAEEIDAALGDDRCYLVVAEHEEGVAGLLSAYRFPDLTAGGSLVYLYDIEVDRRYRKSGVGRRLIELLLECCRNDGVKRVWAGTSVDNAAGRNLFERTGAMVVGDSYVEYSWAIDGNRS